MQPIDLRSDTVTRPTPAMREAMATAEVGDDVWGDDPTVIELEREVAAMLGKQAALYVPSGTMGNQIAIRCQTRPGDEILVHELAHVIVHEAGGVAALSGVQTRMIAGDRGLPGPDQLEPWLRDPAAEATRRLAFSTLLCGELGVPPGEMVAINRGIKWVAGFAGPAPIAGLWDDGDEVLL
ncbi:MAG TPA: beta-eliminating lyase-related protein, partial [Gaiellales bacterium]|nr:beta-eliminating lyase-related protein [Gaiellales bacterium]